MHLIHQQTPEQTELASIARHHLQQLTDGKLPNDDFTVPANTQLSPEKDVVFFLVSGQVQYLYQGKPSCLYEPGDLLGIESLTGHKEGEYNTIEASTLKRCTRQQLDNMTLYNNTDMAHWSQYLSALSRFFRLAFAQENRGHYQPATGFQHYSRGDQIIRQGDHPNYVYTLLDGEAKAEVDGTTVGTISKDEIFGALAVFTKQPRNASVIALSECTVMSVPKEDFLNMIEHQPHFCLGLIKEMADKISALNQRLTR